MSLKTFLLVLAITATAYSQSASNFDYTEYRRCTRSVVERLCTNSLDFYRNELDRLVNCGQSEAARLVSNYCSRDEEANLYCGAAESYPALLGMTLSFCDSAIRGGNCSDECTNNLMAIRNELGCCVNAFFNNTALYATFAPVLSYPLWSMCDVDPPNSTCDGALPYTPLATPLRTCTVDEIYTCREPDTELIRNAVLEEPESCHNIIQYNMARCSHLDASDDGLCFAGLPADVAVTIPSIVSISNCAPTLFAMQPCSSSCRASLESFVESRGCCVNSLYNSTFSVVTGLNFSVPYFQQSTLFDMCGVEAPPLTCTDESRSLPLKSFTLMMLLPLIITALLGNKI